MGSFRRKCCFSGVAVKLPLKPFQILVSEPRHYCKFKTVAYTVVLCLMHNTQNLQYIQFRWEGRASAYSASVGIASRDCG